jgi:hypothetical protein
MHNTYINTHTYTHAATVPTNGMRACTAAIIELSAHKSLQYSSEVEFVSRCVFAFNCAAQTSVHISARASYHVVGVGL